jgi:ATP/maltotriose-dependent transcriptional regulator MalT
MARHADLSPAGALAAGEAALLRAAWDEARGHFEAALAGGETAEALCGLGIAARSLADGRAALDAHERGYRLARKLGDTPAAARLALELVFDCYAFRGPAELNGWLERARSVLEGLPTSREHAVLAYVEANLALNRGHDPAAARALVARGLEIARAARSVDGEMVCLALEGLAYLADGDVQNGMRRLDEATTAAVAGEVVDARLVQVICCHLIDGCKRVRDFGRAGEWCERVEQIADRFDDAEMFATCRVQYGEVLVWRGAWSEAEETLTAACREARFPRLAADGLVRLAELRRRQGRLEEAAALLEQAGDHRQAEIVRAALALDGGDAAGAADGAERFLRRVGDRDRFERVPALELLVRARLALGREGEAEQAAEELEAIVAVVETPSLRAAALLARGRILARTHPEHAIPVLEDALDLLRRSGVRSEAAQAGAELAEALRAAGLHDAAERAEAAVRTDLAALGAVIPEPPARVRSRSLLTRREAEVLRLLAQGLSNEEIAARLVLSVRTVESHVASLYGKIGVSGRTARAAATAYALANGLG